MSIRILQGDCREVMKTLPDNSVDSIVCDPPYELTAGKKGGTGVASVNLDSPYGRSRIGTGNGAGGFMGMKWDATGVAFDPETWRQCLRVLKPGGHLLAFGGTRTQHRMVCAIEDAGFEIRDQAGWMYGSGFPKSLDVSKAIDKAAGAQRTEISGVKPGHEDFVHRTDAHAAGGNADGWDRPWKSDPEAIAKSHMMFAPATEAAKQWEGWGTALKPAWEPICVARKPLGEKNVAANVLKHGTGALNIDGCRIKAADAAYARNHSGDRGHAGTRSADEEGATNLHAGGGSASDLGRWPANLLHDGSPEVVALFPKESGAAAPVKGSEPSSTGDDNTHCYGKFNRVPGVHHGDSGSAARFFWCPKTSASDRHEGLQHPGTQFTTGSTLRDAENLQGKGNHHPTVKPTELMRYLCRLVTPPGGTVLDPFAGSGSTLKAAELEGFDAIGIELSPEYIEIARRRVAGDAPLFADVQVDAP